METINFPLLFGEHKKCDNTIKKLIQENFNLRKKQNDLFKLLGIKNIDEIYNFIVKKINNNIDELIKKDEIIKKYQEEIKKSKTFEKKVITFLNKHEINILNKLDDFSFICKCNCISSEEPKINKIISRKVPLNNCLYNNFKKKKDDRIIKNKKRMKIVYNKIVLFINYKKVNSFNALLKINKNIIDTYSNYYTEYLINKKVKDIEIASKLYDRNKNKFIILVELYYLIKKDNYLYNSNYIFDHCTLSKMHKKKEEFPNFIKLLKEKLKRIGYNNNNCSV